MAKEKLTITIDGYDAHQVNEWLDRKVAEVVAASINEKVGDAIEARVSKLVEEITRERVSKDIDAVLAEGWVETNTYGEPTGKKYTVRDRVHAFFNAKDRYGTDSLVSRWVRDSVDRDLKEAVASETKAAKEKLRAMFDEALTGKFAATIREALGVK